MLIFMPDEKVDKAAAIHQKYEEKREQREKELAEKIAMHRKNIEDRNNPELKAAIIAEEEHKIAKIQQKHEKNRDDLRNKFDTKEIQSDIQHYSLDYNVGFSNMIPGSAKVIINSFKQLMEIELPKRQNVNIPFQSIIGPKVTTDVEIPSDDNNNEYLVYLSIVLSFTYSFYSFNRQIYRRMYLVQKYEGAVLLYQLLTLLLYIII
jgi:hypothetical protein